MLPKTNLAYQVRFPIYASLFSAAGVEAPDFGEIGEISRIGAIGCISKIKEVSYEPANDSYTVVVLVSLALVALLVVGVTMAQSIIPAATEPDAAQAVGPEMVAYDSATSTGLPPDENPPAGSV